MRVGALLSFLLGFAIASGAQSPRDTEAFAAHLERTAELAADAYPGPHRRQLRQRLAVRDERLRDDYRNRHFLTEGPWAAWLDSLTARVVAASPTYFNGLTVVPLVARAPTVNARCYGNGVVAVDLGLLARAPSADAVAFALCHELAHQALRHVDERLAVTLEALYSKDTQRKLRRARAHGGYDDFLALTEQLAFDHSRHTRHGERDADSLGLVLYRAAGFAPDGPAAMLQVLAKADQPAYTAPLPLAQLLDTEAYPFDAAWTDPRPRKSFLQKQDAFPEETRDSLRTHPDTDGRLAALARADVDTAAALRHDDAYGARRPSLRRHLAAGAFAAERLDLALYYALRGVEADATDAWSRGAAALALAELADARAQVDFTAVAPLPSAHANEHTRALAEWLHRLRRNGAGVQSRSIQAAGCRCR